MSETTGPDAIRESEVDGLRRELARLRGFAGVILREHRDDLADVDGGTVQDAAVKFGLLDEVTVTEPCGDACRCDVWGEFPAACCRLSALGRAVFDAPKEPTK